MIATLLQVRVSICRGQSVVTFFKMYLMNIPVRIRLPENLFAL